MDPLTDFVELLRPRAAGTKIIRAAGTWRTEPARMPRAGFGLVLEGACRLLMEGKEPMHLIAGDFILVPAGCRLAMASQHDGGGAALNDAEFMDCDDHEVHYGQLALPDDYRQLGGYLDLAPENEQLFAVLLPAFVHIRAADSPAPRLRTLVELVLDEAMQERPGRALVVNRLVEVLLLEVLRHSGSDTAALPSGLLAGLHEPRISQALRLVHGDPAQPWTLETLARHAGLSRSTFSERFTRIVGVPPMRYLIDWRMAKAKQMLAAGSPSLEIVAEAIGYQSASAFSTAFRREVGLAPSQFAQGERSSS